jgi:parallel beta-helix repeat protein
MRRVRALLIAGGLASVFMGPVPRASAGGVTTEVFPGPNAIQNAVTAASAGDTLLIHTGTYNEDVTVGNVKTGLSLRAYGDGPVVVDAGCGGFTTIDVNAGGVTIDGLRVRGGTYYEIDFNGVPGGVVTGSVLRDTCRAYYGVNVFNVSGTMTVMGNAATGFDDAGIYVGGISNTTATVVVSDNYTFGNNRGIIMEEIVAAANVTVTGNLSRVNRIPQPPGLNPNAGIFLHNADGLLVDGNTVRRNDERGIELDANSSGNAVTNNTISGHTYDLSNLGTNNCFSGNTYTTSNGPLPGCP